MILVDSSVWIDYFNGKANWQTDKLDALLGKKNILVGDLILTEVLQGFKNDTDYRKAKNYLLEFPFLVLGGQDIAIKSAYNYRKLRNIGITVRKTIDVIIGTFCIENKIYLLHKDKDFDALESVLKLKVLHKEAKSL